MSDAGIRLRRSPAAARRDACWPRGCSEDPRCHGVPARGRARPTSATQHPGAVRVDASARLRLRLGLSGRAAGEGQQLHAARPGQGARRLLVAQLVHRVLAARRGTRRLGGDGRRRAGARATSCRTSPAGEQRRPRRRTAAADRCGCATSRRTTRAAQRFSRPRRRSGCRPWRSTAARRCCNGAGWFQINARRGRHPHVDVARLPAPDPRTPAPISRCGPTAGSARSCSTSRCGHRACGTSAPTSPATTRCRRAAR